MASTLYRIKTAPKKQLADLNILQQYEIQSAAWIWHPDFINALDAHVLEFRCQFEVTEETALRLHVSADQRYELSLDGELISRGPDRCDLFHWSFAAYAITLEPGEHALFVRAWWLGEQMPVAQMTSGRGGFILAVEGPLAKALNTGTGGWQVAHNPGWGFGDHLHGHYHVIGSAMHIDGAELHQTQSWVRPVVVSAPLVSSTTGIIKEGWRLFPSPLPDQIWEPRNPGWVRAIFSHNSRIQQGDIEHPAIPEWQNLIQNQIPLELQAHTQTNVLWDLGNYYCAYPEVVLSRGTQAKIKISWAESLFEDPDDIAIPRHKGNRDSIANKRFFGFGDTVVHDGSSDVAYRPLWWRSGRYVLLNITCADEPLVVDAVRIIETRYPVENEGHFSASDPSLADIVPLAVRGIQMCSHETFMDCPYYEQLMYVGDTRLEMLATYMMSSDTALAKRGIELFDWSRYSNGFVAERYPSTPQQASLTFSMLWVALLRDFAWWRDEPEWVLARMVGMRNMLEHVRSLVNSDGLLEALPGWSFVDWVPAWERGMPKGARSGISCVVNLLFAMALRFAADLENAFGEPSLGERNTRLANSIGDSVNQLFWDEERGLLADDVEHSSFSEHAQCLALLTDVLDGQRAKTCLRQLLTDEILHRTTVYFSFYLFEVLKKFERPDLLLERLSFWKDLRAKGFKTPVEKPEPSRSDCHAWGAHPLYHFHASLSGIRPATPGFQSVLIAPQLGSLSEVHSRIPHPRGYIEAHVTVDPNSGTTVSIHLPNGIAGIFLWKGEKVPLRPGDNAFSIASD
jgi:alpha-L-rhamnosidase